MKKRKIIIISLLALLLVSALVISLVYIITRIKERKEASEFGEMLKQYYSDKCAGFAEENKTLGEIDVAFIGDSLTDGYDLKSYYPEFTVINRGIGGDTTHGVLARLDESVIVPEPRVIVMMIGTNNLWDMFSDYEHILTKIKTELPHTDVVLVSIPPSSLDYADRNGQIAVNNVKIASLAEKYGYTYVDVFTPLLDFEVDELRAEYTTDGIHFTPLGYEVITAAVKPVILELLGK